MYPLTPPVPGKYYIRTSVYQLFPKMPTYRITLFAKSGPSLNLKFLLSVLYHIKSLFECKLIRSYRTETVAFHVFGKWKVKLKLVLFYITSLVFGLAF